MTYDYSEDKLVQETTANYFHSSLKWDSVYVYNDEILGTDGTLGRTSEREVVLVRYLREALEKLNTGLPPDVYESAIKQILKSQSVKN